MLAFDWRIATKDVDGVYEADRDAVRRLAAGLAADRGWPADGLNDGVKGFLSPLDNEAKRLSGEFPSGDEPGLRVFLPKTEYLFAMKIRAMRFGGVDENADIDDIRNLANELNLHTADDAIALLLSFYPTALLRPKVQFGLEEIFAAMPGTDLE